MSSWNIAFNKEVVRKYINEIINTGNTEAIENYISDNYVETYNGQRYELGIKGAIEHVEGVRKTYPDLKLSIEYQIGEGEWVSTNYMMKGIHSGEWMGIKPTNKIVRIHGVNLDRVVEGRIVEHTGAANLLEPLMEIGAIKIINS
jgi:predicted ester cyclase